MLNNSEIQKIAKEQLVKRRDIFISLKEFDEGKKNIDISHVQKHLIVI